MFNRDGNERQVSQMTKTNSKTENESRKLIAL